MATIDTSQEVSVPIRTAYNQWTQFESFPKFMEGIESVEQISDQRVRFTGNIYGKTRTWEARIVDQIPDHRVSWQSVDGAMHNGTVRFEPVDSNTTRINLSMEYEPESFTEKAGDALGLLEARVNSDLKRFKDFIESRGIEEGAWRGEIHGGVQTR